MTAFQLQAVPNGRCLAIVLSGEVGIEIAADLAATGAAAARDSEHTTIVLDMGGVSFLDSTGIGAMVEIRTAALDAGKDLRIRNVPARVQRLLGITGLSTAFPVADETDC